MNCLFIWNIIFNALFTVFCVITLLYYNLNEIQNQNTQALIIGLSLLFFTLYIILLCVSYWYKEKRLLFNYKKYKNSNSNTKTFLFILTNYIFTTFYLLLTVVFIICYKNYYFDNNIGLSLGFISFTIVFIFINVIFLLFFHFTKLFFKIIKCIKTNCASFNTFVVCFVSTFLFCFTTFSCFIAFSKFKHTISSNSILNVFLISTVFIILLFVILNIIFNIFFSKQNLTNQQFCVEENETDNVSTS